ncbi:hypothetical protein ABMA28_006643 [Loxostege sticticalis]|uniref:Integrase catalytic domain-containing protein n=1 Tax=Loxostege sticticalis TaxID=481309 RepID=A0ABD0TMV6_LOXSC
MSSSVDLRIPRWHLGNDGVVERELHLFCDASEHAYVAVAYWRFLFPDGNVRLSFICSKSRVAPLTPVSISRLELQAATIAARLASSVCEAHRYKPVRRVFWTDSKNVLGWLRNDARSFLPFVAHRLADILELTNLCEWRWVPTVLNVADDATRPDCGVLLPSSRWIEGPEFLKLQTEEWPAEPGNNNLINTDELKPSAKIILNSYLISVENNPIVIKPLCADPSRFSRWLRFLRSTARAHYYIRCLKSRASVCVSTSHTPAASYVTNLQPLSAEDIHIAQVHIFLQSQEDSFREDKLHKLDVILGSDGLLRRSGRVGAITGLLDMTNTPTVLDGSHRAIRLMIEHEHCRLAHGNNETVVNELRQKHWILKLRSSVRSVAYACQFCRIRKATPLNPPVGNLPTARLTHHHRPFSCVGLDYFGPVLVTVGRRNEKRYVALFTCLTTRAIHLEIVHDLSTDAAVMALRRFTSRRGIPQEIWSDNGTAFVGTKKFLRELYGPEVSDFAANHGIEWRFIPPSAPSMGGAWERLVRSVKSALKVVLKERAPREPVFYTLLAEAEAIVNSRPLTHVSADPADSEALTPFHFLIGSASTGNHFAKADPNDLFGRTAWRKTLRLADLFWQRWVKEYLPLLIPRRSGGSGSHELTPLAVGDLVLIVDGNLPRGSWPRGRIVSLFPGRDNIVRVAEVSTAGGVFRRPCKKLVRLPV